MAEVAKGICRLTLGQEWINSASLSAQGTLSSELLTGRPTQCSAPAFASGTGCKTTSTAFEGGTSACDTS